MARTITYREAINEALAQEMERDESVIVMGEDNAGGEGSPGEHGRLGRCARRDEGAVPQVPGPGAGHADLRVGVHRRRDRRGDGRDAPGRRAHVRRLHGRLLRPDLQPGGEVPVHVRRQGGHAGRDPHHVRGRAPGRGAALTVPVPAVHARPGAEGRPPGHPVRRQGPDDAGDPRQRPGDLLRAQGALRPGRAGAGGELRAAVRGGERGARGRGRHDRGARPHGAHLAGGGAAARRRRGGVRGGRPAHHQPARRGHRAGERRGHRPARRGGRGAPAVLGGHRHLGARRARRPSAHCGPRSRW